MVYYHATHLQAIKATRSMRNCVIQEVAAMMFVLYFVTSKMAGFVHSAPPCGYSAIIRQMNDGLIDQ